MTFTATDPQSHQGENTWFTPKSIIDTLGPFDLDPCTASYRPFNTAKTHIEHDRGECGLKTNWSGFVWMNPPYGKEIVPFIEKFERHNNGIALVFARMGTQWMQNWIASGNGVFFLRKRIRFVSKEGVIATNAGTDSCLLFCGETARQRITLSGLDGVFFGGVA